jgi:hypothetical protein
MSFTFNNGENHIFGTRSGGNETITLKAAYGQQLAVEGSVINTAGIITPSLQTTNTTASTSKTTGSIISAGGIGVDGNIYCEKLVCDDPTASTSTTTGSVLLTGGLGCQDQIHATKLHAQGTTESTSISTGALISNGGIGCAKKLTALNGEFTATTASTSTTTGSLINDGGFGNAGTIYAGGNLFCPNVINSSVVYNTTNNTLTSTSPYNVVINGGGGFWTRLPDTTTLTVGHSYGILNNTGGSVILQTSTGSAITTTFNRSFTAKCINNSSNVAASWSIDLIAMNCCTVHTMSVITIPSGTATNPFTIVSGTVAQQGGALSGTTGGVITVNEAGIYILSGSIVYSSSPAGPRNLWFTLGSGNWNGQNDYFGSSNFTVSDKWMCVPLNLTAGTTITMNTNQGTGSSLSTTYLTQFSVYKIN